MVRHQQAGHDLALDHVSFHDLRHIGFRFHGIPDPFRINHHTGPQSTVVETAGFVGPDDVLQVEPLGFLLEARMQGLRSQLRAASPWVVRRPLVDTDENMALERGQVVRCS